MPSGRVLADHEVVVACGGADHVIRWDPIGRRRGLELLAHGGARDDDDVLVALSGAPARCRAIEAAWDALTVAHAQALLRSSDEQLAQMAHRLPVTLEQRRRVQARDDFTDQQRAALLTTFDHQIAACEVASLGPVLARGRARQVAGTGWRRTGRRWLRRVIPRR